MADLSKLKEDVERAKAEDKVTKKREGSSVEFFGEKIEVGDADDEEVDKFCKDTVFNGFWKTITKLNNSVYLSTKSVGDVLKKLIKKLCDFMECGMMKSVTAIGVVVAQIVAWVFPIPDYERHNETGVLCVPDLEFHNYGETVQNTPILTFFPKTVKEIQDLVKYAGHQGRRIRAAGMKHSWSEVFSDSGELLLYLLPLAVTDTITFARAGVDGMEEAINDWASELNFIEFVEELDEGQHAAVRVGAATTNLQMLHWSNKSGWTLPLDIIAVMITYGGSNAMICHGAGVKNKTLSDLVLKLEFINAKGELQIVDSPETLKAVGGCFGLAGIVTAITLKMNKMTWAKFHPKKTLMRDSIPRPGTDRDDPAFKKMVSLCRDSAYTEFFWFPNRGTEEGYWENCWTDDGLEEDAVDINESVADEYQVASTYLFEIIMKILHPLTLITREEHYDNKTSLEECIRYLFTKAVSMAGVNALPEPDEHITASLVEALHFRRGFHYIAVQEMEMQIPIPSLEDGSPDWSIVSRAWWDAVDLIERSEARGVFACDMALELRVMGGSDVLMAPQFGNKHGTLSIEPVSTRIVHKEVWEDFKDELAKVWMSYKEFDGSPLLSRVHWAKESPRSVTIDEVKYDTVEYWHKIYAENMKEFFAIFDSLTEGVTIGDINRLFSNFYLDSLFKPEWERYGVSLPDPKITDSKSPSLCVHVKQQEKCGRISGVGNKLKKGPSLQDSENITLRIVCCRNLPNKDFLNKSDYYVKVTCDDGTSYKTGVEKSYKHPRFQEQSSTFTLSVNKCASNLLFEVWDKDRLSRDDLIGKVTVQLDKELMEKSKGGAFLNLVLDW